MTSSKPLGYVSKVGSEGEILLNSGQAYMKISYVVPEKQKGLIRGWLTPEEAKKAWEKSEYLRGFGARIVKITCLEEVVEELETCP